jgi:hypothetical protein
MNIYRGVVGESINLPMYTPHQSPQCAGARSLICALRHADAIVIGSPSYHGGVSGLVKKALDYTEDTSKDEAPYFEGRAMGCVATGAGWQGANATLIALRNTVALRGWPTPLGIALNTREPLFGANGDYLSSADRYRPCCSPSPRERWGKTLYMALYKRGDQTVIVASKGSSHSSSSDFRGFAAAAAIFYVSYFSAFITGAASAGRWRRHGGVRGIGWT